MRRFFLYIILTSDYKVPRWEQWAATGVRQWRVVGAAAAVPWLAVPESGPPWGAALLPPPSHRLLGKAGAVLLPTGRKFGHTTQKVPVKNCTNWTCLNFIMPFQKRGENIFGSYF